MTNIKKNRIRDEYELLSETKLLFQITTDLNYELLTLRTAVFLALYRRINDKNYILLFRAL